MQNPPLHCKIFLHLIPEPEEKASELLRDLIANDILSQRCMLMGTRNSSHGSDNLAENTSMENGPIRRS
jgi:hypothetical protein